MCENCGPVPVEVKEAYETFEEAIKVFLTATGNTLDIQTEWVLISAQTEIHAHTDSYAVLFETPLGQALHRTKGLIHETIDNMRAADTAHFVARHLRE